MADLTITAANVAPAGQCSTRIVKIGETVTAGQVLYEKASDSKYWLADADATATADAVGISLHNGSANDYVVMAVAGPVDLGATLTVGETYVVSTTAGGIAPTADLLSGDYVTILGTASGAAVFPLSIDRTGIAKA